MDINKYLNLIPSDNSLKKRFMEYVEAVLDYNVALGSATEAFNLSFDLENAAGSQLDMIGDMVGIDRVLRFAPTVGDMSMSDSEYRLMIKMTIAKHGWDGTNIDAEEIYKEIFSGFLEIFYTDNMDCSLDIYISGVETAREAEILNSADGLLVPAGVHKTVHLMGANIETEVVATANITGIEVINPVKMLE